MALGACSDSSSETADADSPATAATTTDRAADATAASSSSTNAAGIRRVSPETAQDLLAGDVTLIDVRTPEEYSAGHLEDATLVDIAAPGFADEIAALPRDASYVLYCRSGNRSAQALDVMATLGFTDVADIEGGIVAWEQAGLPITQ